MNGTYIILVLIFDLALAYVTVKVAKAYLKELSVLRTILIVLAWILIPIAGLIILLYYSFRLMFRRKPSQEAPLNEMDLK